MMLPELTHAEILIVDRDIDSRSGLGNKPNAWRGNRCADDDLRGMNRQVRDLSRKVQRPTGAGSYFRCGSTAVAGGPAVPHWQAVIPPGEA
jgi:hypothetical protein